MNDALQRRHKFLLKDFDRQPCAKMFEVALEELNALTSRMSMPISPAWCVIDNDGTCVIQGGVIAVLADFAAVYLARMHSSFPGITPLVNLNEDYRRPCVWGKDKRIVARACINDVLEKRILIKVIIENEMGEQKGEARLAFAKRFH